MKTTALLRAAGVLAARWRAARQSRAFAAEVRVRITPAHASPASSTFVGFFTTLLALTFAVVDVPRVHAIFSGTLTGTLPLPSTAAYLIEVPPAWNGTVVLYSHALRPGSVGPAMDSPAFGPGVVSDPVTHDWLLSQGYALAGSSYSSAFWAVQEAFQDQIAVIDLFASQVAPPMRTVAWGQSLGGMITAGFVQLHPERFAGALPMCGLVAGGIATLNLFLDTAFVFQTLIDPSLQIVHLSSSGGPSFTQFGADILNAQTTAAGQARIALASAVADVPGWVDFTAPEPSRHDYAAQEVAQFTGAEENVIISTLVRADVESRAGGNPSSNTGVDYGAQLRKSIDRKEVVALYKAAGLSLDQDLAALAAAPRIAADPPAQDYLNTYITLNGKLNGVPVLTLHTTGDGVVVVESERAYKDTVVAAAGDRKLLRQVYVHRAGHCSFTSAEMIAAFQALVQRIDTGRWGDLRPRALNQQAAALGVGSSDFVRFRPKPFLRPFTN